MAPTDLESANLVLDADRGLVPDRKEGHNVYYAVPDPHVHEFRPIDMAMSADNATHLVTCHCIPEA